MRAGRLGPVSIQARLTLWYSVILLVVLTTCGVGVYVFQYRLGLARVDVDLQRAVDLLAETLMVELEEEPWPVVVQETLEELTFPGRTVAILDEHDQPLAAREEALDVERAIEAGFAETTHTVATAAGEWRVLSRRVAHVGATLRVVMVDSLAPLGQDLGDLRRILLIGIPLALLLAAAGGWTIARRGLTPLTRLASEAREMGDDRSGLRLTDPGTRDQLAILTAEFNDLLGRLDAVLRGQRQFMADASHELRTPISVIRNATEVTLSQPARSPAEYADSLGIVGEQATRLTRIVDDMFLLARADAGGRPIEPSRFYLDELVDECLRGIGVLAQSLGVRLQPDVCSDVEIEGDENLLRRMLMNLLDNAVQHTPSGASMQVSLARSETGAEIVVHNEGDGIPAADRERVFERFVRLDAVRSRSDRGGLGLPIARWVAEAHGGTLVLDSSGTDGVTFIVRLPLPAP